MTAHTAHVAAAARASAPGWHEPPLLFWRPAARPGFGPSSGVDQTASPVRRSVAVNAWDPSSPTRMLAHVSSGSGIEVSMDRVSSSPSARTTSSSSPSGSSTPGTAASSRLGRLRTGVDHPLHAREDEDEDRRTGDEPPAPHA